MFSERLRTAGYQVKCIEPDPVQRERLEEQGFDTFANIASVPDDSGVIHFLAERF